MDPKCFLESPTSRTYAKLLEAGTPLVPFVDLAADYDGRKCGLLRSERRVNAGAIKGLRCHELPASECTKYYSMNELGHYKLCVTQVSSQVPKWRNRRERWRCADGTPFHCDAPSPPPSPPLSPSPPPPSPPQRQSSTTPALVT